MLVFTTMGIFNSFPGVVYALVTGKLYYETVIPLSDASFSWGWWLQFLYQSVDALYSGVFYSLKEFLMITLAFHIARLIRVQVANVEDMSKQVNMDPAEELRRMKRVLSEMNAITK